MLFQPNIELLPEKKMVGKKVHMSLVNNKTFELWSSFMPLRNKILNGVGEDFYSLQVYPSDFDFQNFDIHKEFEKWALKEVSHFEAIPDEMEAFVLVGGKYAVFHYKGDSSRAAEAFQYIFTTWLPNSGYVLDNRPHFEILGENYKNNDPSSEEEIWIPIS